MSKGTRNVKDELKAALAVAVMFFINGALFGSWASRIPSIQTQLSLEAGPLGTAMFALGLGALSSMPIAGILIGRFGSRLVTIVFLLLFCGSLALIPVAKNLWQLALVLSFFGCCGSAMDVAMNANGVAVQRHMGKPIMSRLHALWSIGAMSGAAFGALMANLETPPQVHFLLVCVFLILTGGFAQRSLLSRQIELRADTPDEDSKNHAPAPRPRSQAFLLFCTICFLAFMCEGSVADWSGLYLQNSLHTNPSFAACAYSSFSMAMAAGRLAGDFLICRLGANNLLRYGNLGNCFVLALMLWLANPWVAIVGFAITGIGLCTVAPIVYSQAADLGTRGTASTIAGIAVAGYCGVLVGPPILGYAAQIFGFSAPFVGVATVSFLIFVLALVIDSERSSTAVEAPYCNR